MSALTEDQLELPQRASDGLPMWGGSVATERLRRDVDLLFALRLIKPAAEGLYRLTPTGTQVLAGQDRFQATLASRLAGRSHPLSNTGSIAGRA